MNDEIKEIITRINKEIEKHIKDGYSEDMLVIYELDVLQWRILLDYITNLQQIEQDHKETNATLMSELAELEEEKQFVKDCGFENAQQLALDYIGIRQENERLKHQLKIQEDLTIKNRMRKHIYKSRCEKAIEYIMTELIDEWSIRNQGYVSGSDLPVDAITPLLNILQNGSDSQ